jgi:hypothetical protein
MEDFAKVVLGFYNAGIQHAKKPSVPHSYFANDRSVRAKLKEQKGSFGNQLIPMPPTSGLAAHIGLWCEWDFSGDTHWCNIEVMFSRTADQSWGFRVDSPHKPRDGMQKHEYWHSQFMRQFYEPTIMFPKCKISWIDDSTPAHPIALENPGAVRPIDALVYSIISIYGQNILPDLRTLLLKIGVSTSLRKILGP